MLSLCYMEFFFKIKLNFWSKLNYKTESRYLRFYNTLHDSIQWNK